MLIVLEGCDGTGKTTLANFLAKVLDAQVVHCTSTTPNDYDFFDDIISAAVTENVIADRFCYGQFVYQTESERRLTKAEMHRLEARMLQANTKVILVKASRRAVEARLHSRHEITLLPVQDILDGFERVLGESILQVIHYNTDKEE